MNDNSKLAVLKLDLQNYRNFKHYTIEAGCDPVVIIGANGVGKTNILEAISLFAFGRGLKGAKFDQLVNTNDSITPAKHAHDEQMQEAYEIQNAHDTKIREGFESVATHTSPSGVECGKESSNSYCSVVSTQRTKIGDARIDLEFSRNTNFSRSVLFNNQRVPTQDLHKFTDVFWFTHNMHQVIAGSKQERRSFFDKLTYSLFPTHAKVTSQYNQLIKRRIEMLVNNDLSSSALDHLESQITRCAKTISDNRTQYLEKLNLQSSYAPPSFLSAKVCIDQICDSEESYMQLLQKNRKRDSVIKRTSSGVHLANFDLFFFKNADWRKAEIASNGEQKAAIITLFFSHVHLYIESFGYTPIILLDEFFAHLDQNMADAILHFLHQQRAQFWITGIDMRGIELLEQYANVIDLCLE
ncbi:AAA family ATPase [Candidatus Sarmatiella mevalonica]|uniref:AAA family ATPase n=1 Tax=Candidatus Sarmatiella mevalonica TaxID=2770581 RepID=UPI0019239983